MPVDQERRAEIAEAKLDLEKAKSRRVEEAAISIGYFFMSAVPVLYCYVEDSPRVYLVITAFIAGCCATLFLNTMRKLNTVVRLKRKRVEELSGE